MYILKSLSFHHLLIIVLFVASREEFKNPRNTCLKEPQQIILPTNLSQLRLTRRPIATKEILQTCRIVEVFEIVMDPGCFSQRLNLFF